MRGQSLHDKRAGRKELPGRDRGDCRVTAQTMQRATAPDTPAPRRFSYSYQDLIDCAHGKLFGPGNARLPLPPMLMVDRIVRISDKGGKYDKGEIVAELDIKPNLWFFNCHFESDPIMPGALGLDALWQLVGFFLGWLKAPGRGRALGVGEVKFSGEVLPDAKTVTYKIDIKRVILRKLTLGIADGAVEVDGRTIYEIKDLRVGLSTTALQPAGG